MRIASRPISMLRSIAIVRRASRSRDVEPVSDMVAIREQSLKADRMPWAMSSARLPSPVAITQALAFVAAIKAAAWKAIATSALAAAWNHRSSARFGTGNRSKTTRRNIRCFFLPQNHMAWAWDWPYVV
jgi:hypothetical protein